VDDTIAPDASCRDRYDDLPRVLDASHRRALLADELVEMLRDTVGPLAHVDVWDNEYRFGTSVMGPELLAALRADLDGDAISGFRPRADGDAIAITFTDIAVQAVRPSG
jgi:hypothetical protein